MKEYFSHDYNARDDDKMPKLLSEVGYEGYGIYWALLEQLYKNNGVMQLHYKSIAFALHCDESCLTKVINDFDLFKVNGESFTSESVLRRLQLRTDISEKRRSAAKSRDYAKAEQKQSKTDANAPKIKEKKIKEKKLYTDEILLSDYGWLNDPELLYKLKCKYSKLFTLKYPLKYNEHIELIKDWTAEKVRDIYSEMQNYAQLESKSESANLTARNWLTRNKKREATNVR